jgi:hypothetical protein
VSCQRGVLAELSNANPVMLTTIPSDWEPVWTFDGWLYDFSRDETMSRRVLSAWRWYTSKDKRLYRPNRQV